MPRFSIPNPLWRWRQSRKIRDIERRQRIEKIGAARTGPPAIAVARTHIADRPDIRIDPLETEYQVESSQIAVRAWIIIPRREIPDELDTSIAQTTYKLGAESLTIRIFFLSVSYRVPTADIAFMLGMSRRAVRRTLLRAISRIATRSP